MRSTRKPADLGDDVVVAGVVLHRARLAPHVHEHQPGTGLGHDREHVGIAPSGGDVVHHHRAGVERGPGDDGLARVDAHRE